MSSLWPDLTVRTLLDSSLVLAQALLLNGLGVPFAAITLFSGIAGYGVAVAVQYGAAATMPLLLSAIALLVGFVVLVPSLPEDRYLLLSLAALALTRSLAGSLSALGGQLGTSSAAATLPPQQPVSYLIFVVPLFVLTLAGMVVLSRSQLGLAVDIARLARLQPTAAALAPLPTLRFVLFGFAVLSATAAGILQGLYSGRVDPNTFRLDGAITILVVTLAAGRRPLRSVAVALGFFLFPEIFAWLFGYQRAALAHLREIVWSLAILIIAGYRLEPSRTAGRSLPVGSTLPSEQAG